MSNQPPPTKIADCLRVLLPDAGVSIDTTARTLALLARPSEQRTAAATLADGCLETGWRLVVVEG